MSFIVNSRNAMYCWYLCTVITTLLNNEINLHMKKCFFLSHFPFFLRSFFIITNVNFEIFIKTPVFLYFYDEARSSHRRCSMKKLFLKISQYSKKTSLLESLLNKVAGLQAWLQKRLQHRRFPVNITKNF